MQALWTVSCPPFQIFVKHKHFIKFQNIFTNFDTQNWKEIKELWQQKSFNNTTNANQGKVLCIPTIQNTFNLFKHGPNFKRKVYVPKVLKWFIFQVRPRSEKGNILRPLFSTNPDSIRFRKINFMARKIRKLNQGSEKIIERNLKSHPKKQVESFTKRETFNSLSSIGIRFQTNSDSHCFNN